jgi:hypothetical protein
MLDKLKIQNPGFELDRKNQFANFLLENLKENFSFEK